MTNEEFQELVLSELKGIKSEITDMKLKQQDNTAVIKSLLYNQEISNAKFKNLGININEDFLLLNSKIDALNTRIFHQESELTKLRAIK